MTMPYPPPFDNPLNRIKLVEAVKTKAKSLKLIGGVEISINYEKRKGKIWVEPIPNDEYPNPYVPCGWFSVKKVLDVAEFLEPQDVVVLNKS